MQALKWGRGRGKRDASGQFVQNGGTRRKTQNIMSINDRVTMSNRKRTVKVTLPKVSMGVEDGCR